MKSTKFPNPQWYPFASHFFPTPDGHMHYIDTGNGEPIVFVHGTPAWSFLYRSFIQKFSANYRCIAPDHLGFGLSDKPEHFQGAAEDHAKRFESFMLHLDLKNITLVVHDFGGPIGLPFATQHPDRIKRIVLFNTFLCETAHLPAVQKVDKILNSTIGKFLYLRFNFSPRVLLRQAFYQKNKLSKEVHLHYTTPFPGKKDRMSLLLLGKSLAGSSNWFGKEAQNLHFLANKPICIIWGMQDKFITPEFLAQWIHHFPYAKVHKLDCGHFIQEEEPEAAQKAMEMFFADKTMSFVPLT